MILIVAVYKAIIAQGEQMPQPKSPWNKINFITWEPSHKNQSTQTRVV